MDDLGKRIYDLRKARGMTLEQVGLAVGVGRSTVRKWENGIIANMRRDKIKKLADALGTTPAYIMGWTDNPDETESDLPVTSDVVLMTIPSLDNVLPMPTPVTRPRLGTIACGEPILAEQNILGYDQVPDYVKCDFTLLCKGDSMTGARIYDGDIVCIKQTAEVESGQIAAVLIDGDFDAEATLKRVRYGENSITLWPENPAYEPLVFQGEETQRVHIIGLATHFISKVK